MLTAATAQDVADAYGLEGSATLTGPVARGQLGQVWRLDTEAGTHAVKEWFATPDLAAMSRDADLVAAALAEGVVTPRIVHTTTGAVATTVADTAVRVFEWVDLRGPMRGLDPAAVGATLAALHRAGPPTDEPVDNWFATASESSAGVSCTSGSSTSRRPSPGTSVPSSTSSSPSSPSSSRTSRPSSATATCGPTTCSPPRTGGSASSTSRTSARPTRARSSRWCSSSSATTTRRERDCIHTAYRDAGGPGRVTRRGHFTMLVAEQAHIGQLACSRWVGASSESERERLATWFLEIPDDPVTLPRIDRVLAAVT